MMTRKKIIKPNYSSLVKRGALILACLCLVTYVGMQLSNIFRGPKILLTEALPSSTQESLLTLAGTAERAQTIRVNGAPVALDINQTFSLPLLLVPGYNVITIEAQDQFGKTTRMVYELVRAPQVIASRD